MSNLPFRMASTGDARPGASSRHQDESAAKNSSSLFPRNPLMSLDSDEEIQGNPTLMIGGFRSKPATSQENPNGSIGPASRPAAEKQPTRSSKCEAP
jgi:hypothetical protein